MIIYADSSPSDRIVFFVSLGTKLLSGSCFWVSAKEDDVNMTWYMTTHDMTAHDMTWQHVFMTDLSECIWWSTWPRPPPSGARPPPGTRARSYQPGEGKIFIRDQKYCLLETRLAAPGRRCIRPRAGRGWGARSRARAGSRWPGPRPPRRTGRTRWGPASWWSSRRIFLGLRCLYISLNQYMIMISLVYTHQYQILRFT